MSEMPNRVAIAQHEDVRAGTWIRWWWPHERGATNPLGGREYVRADIADTMQDALQRFMDATDNVDGDTKGEKLIQIMRSRFSKAIAKAEGKA